MEVSVQSRSTVSEGGEGWGGREVASVELPTGPSLQGPWRGVTCTPLSVPSGGKRVRVGLPVSSLPLGQSLPLGCEVLTPR